MPSRVVWGSLEAFPCVPGTFPCAIQGLRVLLQSRVRRWPRPSPQPWGKQGGTQQRRNPAKLSIRQLTGVQHPSAVELVKSRLQ